MSEGLALYTTVYPGVEPYLSVWYQSVVAQTDHKFDLWIGLDSLHPAKVIELTGAKPESINFITGNEGSPAQIRQGALEFLVDEYPAIVFVDSDDLLYPSRIAAARKALESYDVVGCALSIIDEEGCDLGITFGGTDGEQFSSLLPRYNVFGLSNTAYRSEIVRDCLPLGDACDLVDWTLATRAWAGGASLKFEQQPQMAYRQYSRNIARVLLPFSCDQVVKASERVLGHYQCLLESERPVNGACGAAIRDANERALLFDHCINESPEVLDSYVAALNQKTPRYVWWWCVAHPELEYIWRN
ncbi:MAG: glycosyltransferase family 2 protein [Pyrinomonadaceae bacterium]|nr:glycosyltransferase family 2 protein [Pyrinomonadaceae bacterium]